MIESVKIMKSSKTAVIDWLMTVASVIHPLTAVPQVYTIYTTQDVSGVSLWTWLGFSLIGLIFLSYGIAHNLKPFILNQILWFTIDFLVVLGVIIFQK